MVNEGNVQLRGSKRKRGNSSIATMRWGNKFFECFHNVPIHHAFYCNNFRAHRCYILYIHVHFCWYCNQTQLGIFRTRGGNHLLGSWQTLCFRIIYCLPLASSALKHAKDYSHGQPKPANFVAVGIPILDMTETPPEAWKCWKMFIQNTLKRLVWADHPKTQYLPFWAPKFWPSPQTIS